MNFKSTLLLILCKGAKHEDKLKEISSQIFYNCCIPPKKKKKKNNKINKLIIITGDNFELVIRKTAILDIINKYYSKNSAESFLLMFFPDCSFF